MNQDTGTGKRKRIRPTVGQMRALLKQLADTEDVVERQCEELRGWREQYHQMEDSLQEQIAHLQQLAEETQGRTLAARLGRLFKRRNTSNT